MFGGDEEIDLIGRLCWEGMKRSTWLVGCVGRVRGDRPDRQVVLGGDEEIDLIGRLCWEGRGRSTG